MVYHFRVTIKQFDIAHPPKKYLFLIDKIVSSPHKRDQERHSEILSVYSYFISVIYSHFNHSYFTPLILT